MSLRLIGHLAVPRDAAIIDIGGGTSYLVDALLGEGFGDVTVLDISGVALAALRERLGSRSPVTLIHSDLLSWIPERRFDLWHDRAVFHFLVQDVAREQYLAILHRALHPGSTIVLGTFGSDGPELCSGLPVARYSAEELRQALGTDLEVLAEEQEEHVTPAGTTQPFTWVAARLR